ncbi:MAG: DUF1858 domain-containing protein [Candidatus Wallbacteria bacterium]|nr:DUF1858 domain-containing protein [Candidatus Wallbacteria bacterium]
MITKDMGIRQIIEEFPQAITFFSQHNLGCIGCMAASFETLEQGLNAHGFDINKFMKELNEFIGANPA